MDEVTALMVKCITRKHQEAKDQKNFNITVRSRAGLALAMQKDNVSDKIAQVLLSSNLNEK